MVVETFFNLGKYASQDGFVSTRSFGIVCDRIGSESPSILTKPSEEFEIAAVIIGKVAHQKKETVVGWLRSEAD